MSAMDDYLAGLPALERAALEKIIESVPPLSLGQDQAAAEE